MDFSAKNIASQIASIKTDTLSNLLNPKAGSTFDLASLSSEYMATHQANSDLASNTVNATNSVAGLSPTGRNPALADPESAYQMMSVINFSNAAFQAQHAELADMAQGVRQLGQSAAQLTAIDAATPLNAMQNKLQTFADQYNSWRLEFDAALQDPNQLGNTQAAQLARHELQASINSPFHGANAGMQGLAAMGISTNAQGFMQLDRQQLAAQWQSNPAQAAQALNDFGQHFNGASEQLLAPNQSFAKQTANLDKAISYIKDSQTALPTEFGLGDPPKLSPQMQKLLAEYQSKVIA